MRDFTILQYSNLIQAFIDKGYIFQTFCQHIENPVDNKFVILRHDVDKLPINSLRIAQIEHQFGIHGSYYFRITKESNNPEIIMKISELGHEIGYHYEDMALVNGDIKSAIKSFTKNLDYFRQFYPVKTICMHGNPLSRWDNRDIWKSYNYNDFGVVGEPYFDINYNRIFYITDTGRKWNNQNSNVRDFVSCSASISIKSTDHFISLIKHDKSPDRIMINTHPHRWFDKEFGWYRELIFQNIKNLIKQLIVQYNKK